MNAHTWKSCICQDVSCLAFFIKYGESNIIYRLIFGSAQDRVDLFFSFLFFLNRNTCERNESFSATYPLIW